MPARPRKAPPVGVTGATAAIAAVIRTVEVPREEEATLEATAATRETARRRAVRVTRAANRAGVRRARTPVDQGTAAARVEPEGLLRTTARTRGVSRIPAPSAISQRCR